MRFWKEDPRGRVPVSTYQRYMLSSCLPTVNMSLNHLAEAVLSGSSIVKPPSCPCPQPCALWKEVTRLSPHLSIGESFSRSLRMKYLHKLFGIALHGEFISSSPFINLLSDLFTSVRTGCLICFGLEPDTNFYFIAQIVPDLGWLLCPFDIPLSIIGQCNLESQAAQVYGDGGMRYEEQRREIGWRQLKGNGY